MAHVLVVDDDRTNTQLIKMVLEMDKFSVTVAPNVTKALEALDTKPDALIVDYYLAGGENGIDLVNSIRSGATSIPTDTPILVTSGDDRRRVESNRAGANVFLLKPYGPSQLSEELTTLLTKGESSG